MKNLLLLFFLITLAFSAVTRKAVCILDAPYSKVKGQIDISYNSTSNTTTFVIAFTNTTGLVAQGNGFHVHQYGVDNKSVSCGDAGKHYNPLLNYGEISARASVIPINGSVNITAPWLAFEGEYSILGRSLVVHDNTTTRHGCCTIHLVEEAAGGNTTLGYSNSTLKARFSDVNATFYQSGGMVFMNISVNSTLNSTLSYISIRTTNCSSSILYNITTPFTNTSMNNSQITLTNLTSIGNFAGRAVVRTYSNGSEECVYIIQQNAQENHPGNDFYIDPANGTVTTATDMSTNATTAMTSTNTTTATDMSTNATTAMTSTNATTATTGMTSTNATTAMTSTNATTAMTSTNATTATATATATATRTATATGSPNPSSSNGASVWLLSMFLLIAFILV